jgi:hypothetical protein
LQTVLGIILGGGAGTRLYPLTKKRAKPAVPLGAQYRLIDIPVSNCINSGVNKIYCLTQFNSASLNRHMSQAYNAVSSSAPSCYTAVHHTCLPDAHSDAPVHLPGRICCAPVHLQCTACGASISTCCAPCHVALYRADAVALQ